MAPNLRARCRLAAETRARLALERAQASRHAAFAAPPWPPTTLHANSHAPAHQATPTLHAPVLPHPRISRSPGGSPSVSAPPAAAPLGPATQPAAATPSPTQPAAAKPAAKACARVEANVAARSSAGGLETIAAPR